MARRKTYHPRAPRAPRLILNPKNEYVLLPLRNRGQEAEFCGGGRKQKCRAKTRLLLSLFFAMAFLAHYHLSRTKALSPFLFLFPFSFPNFPFFSFKTFPKFPFKHSANISFIKTIFIKNKTSTNCRLVQLVF